MPRGQVGALREEGVAVGPAFPVCRLDAELVEQASLQPHDGVFRFAGCAQLSFQYLTETLEVGWSVDELRAGFADGLCLDGVGIGGRTGDLALALQSGCQRQQVADGDLAAAVAAPFGQRLRGGLVDVEQSVGLGEARHHAGEALRAAGQLPSFFRGSGIGIGLEQDLAVLHHEERDAASFG